MKLSEAIKEGIKLYPNKCRTVYTSGNMACALGAAWFGANEEKEPIYELLVEKWPELGEDILFDYEDGYALYGTENVDLHELVARLNDTYHWKREEIAEWLELNGL